MFKNIDVIYSSSYIRTLATAKYLAVKLDKEINIDNRFGERKFGIDETSPLPDNFFTKQWTDFDYKNGDGESINEVTKRTNEALNEILEKEEGKQVFISCHGTAMAAMFRNYLDIVRNDEKQVLEFYYKQEKVFSGLYDAPELFKLVFEGKKLVLFENIKYDKE